jgi:hypothetical protein
MNINRAIRSFLKSEVYYLLLQRGWQIIGGVLTVIILPTTLTVTEQGYYFTFASLIAMQVFFELGLNLVVTQLAGHESSKLVIDEGGLVSGDIENAERLLSLIALLKVWYKFASPLFALGLGLAGFVFFNKQGDLLLSEWLGVWSLIVFFTALNLYFSSHLSFNEGIGRVGQVARLRLKQSALGMCMMWIGFALGFGLWAVPCVSGVAALMTWLWLRSHGQFRISFNISKINISAINWRRDILPMQWRIALSWLSGWIIFNIFTPLVFANQGAAEAARIGMATAMFSAISTMSGSWANAATPKFTTYIALGERLLLRGLLIKTFVSGVSFAFFASVALIIFVSGLQFFGSEYSDRISSLPVLFCFALVTISNSFIFVAAVYMRAHKEEPMLWPSVVMGVLTGFAAWFGSKDSTLAMSVTYAFFNISVALPWAIILLIRYYKRSCS